MIKVYYDKDAQLDALKGKKICIMGYGSQGMPMRTTSGRAEWT